MTPAFYKGKLQGLVEISKQSVKNTCKHFEDLCKDGPAKIDMIKEISDMMTSLILNCVLSEDLSLTKLDYYENGRVTKKDVSFLLRTCFQKSLERVQSLHVIFFPFLASYSITPYERDLKRNCQAVRNLIGQLIDQRRSEIESKSSNKGDLLSLLLEDPLFSQNNEIIIDELLTIFFAGSQTSANVTQNLILHLCK